MKRLLGFAVFAGIVVSGLPADVEIVVVASRIPEESRRTPAVVRVIPEEDIERSDTVLDAVARAPGVRVVRSSPGDAFVTMGGFGENGFMRTLVLRDGVPLNKPDQDSINWRAIPLSRVERIEVLTGPASARYGDQAVAGVINIVTSDPTPGVSVEASASVDSNLSNEQALALSWGQAGAVDLGLSADVTRSDYRPERERSDYGMWSTSLVGSLEAGWLSGRLRGYYTPSSYQMPGALTEEEFDEDPTRASNTDDVTEQVEYGAALTSVADVGRVTLRLPVSVAVTDSRIDFASFSSYSDSTLTSLDTAAVVSGLFFVGESVALTPTAGVDYRRATLEVDTYASADRTSALLEARLERDVYAPWLRLRISWRDLLILESGGRYEYAPLEARSAGGGTAGDDTHTPVVFDAAVSYLPTRNTRLSLRYGRTFRYPALDEQFSYITGSFNEELDPENGHTVVLGASYEGEGASVSLSSFVGRMSNEIVYDLSQMRNVNLGETRRYGGALDASYVTGPVTLGAGYEYTRAEFAAGDNEGNVVPLVPAHEVSGDMTVRLPVGFELGSDVTRSSGYYEGGDAANDLDMIPGRTEWNARLGWTGPAGFSAYLAARNLLDDRTPTRVYFGGWYPMPGRTFEVGTRWTY